MTEDKTTRRRKWHQAFGDVLEVLLTPVKINVLTDLPVLSSPPKMDILILRTEGLGWTSEQRARLPHGIRDVRASQIVLEFKKTESFNEAAVKQALIYETLHLANQGLKQEEVATFVVSSQTPHKNTLAALGYEATKHPGVSRSRFPILERIILISLNDLTDTTFNAAFKIFASKRKEQTKAFNTLMGEGKPQWLVDSLKWLISMLYNLWFKIKGGPDMILQFTKEQIKETCELLGEETVLQGVSPQTRLKGISASDRLKGISASDRLKGLSAKDRLQDMSEEDCRIMMQLLKNRTPQG